MELAEQKKLSDSAQTFFDGKLKTIIRDNRRRYRMQLKDAKERTGRGLSAIPSTKSTAAVDRFVERVTVEMFQDPDSISFTARATGDPSKDDWARWLTQDFSYRAKNTFDFFNWHLASATAGAVDGLECALVYWRKEAYSEPATEYSYTDPVTGQQTPVDQATHDKYSAIFPEYQAAETQKSVVTLDTWWIDQLEPGKDIIWDPQVPLLNIDMGQFCRVTLRKTKGEILSMAESGLLDPAIVTEEMIKKYQKPGTSSILYANRNEKTVDDPDNSNLQDANRVELCCFFFKQGNRWMCQFSFEMKEVVSEIRPVNDVWFGGRQVNVLPAAVGTCKLKLWEAVGRAIPETIAPIEDEHCDHINNMNDAAKIAIQGRQRVDPDSDIDIDQLLNGRVVYAEKGSFDAIETDFGVLNTLRADDARTQEMNELIPAGISSGARGVVPKGTNKTLGATQMGMMESDQKTGVQIMTRNNTFLRKVLFLIAQNTMAFETDDVVLRIAGEKAKITLPEVTTMSGKRILDLSVLDFAVDIEINAGLGAVPLHQKADAVMQLTDWGIGHQLPVDAMASFKQLTTLAGYSAEQFIMQQPPPEKKPAPEDKLIVNIDLATLLQLKPEVATFVMDRLFSGEMSVEGKVKDNQAAMNEQRQNGGGFMTPDRTGQLVDGTGAAALGMSQGGMQ